ncbi:MAG: T9SS type A sorting domain-containing protein [Candidatus Hydrothermae bacterium]|nr:T9SS type A sorting domain-containing protein [Candidatus Hydrothermae bacterium]
MKKSFAAIAVVLALGTLGAQNFPYHSIWLSESETGLPVATNITVVGGSIFTLHAFAKSDSFDIAGVVMPLKTDSNYIQLVDGTIDSSTFEGWMFKGFNYQYDAGMLQWLWYAAVPVDPVLPLPMHEVHHIGSITLVTTPVGDTVVVPIDTLLFPPTNVPEFSDPDGFSHTPNWIPVTVTIVPAPTDVEESNPVRSYYLHKITPNPSKGSAMIQYGLPKESEVEIALYNSAGQRVRTLFKGMKKAGSYTFNLDMVSASGSNLPDGTYFISIQAGNWRKVEKFLLVK